MKQQVIVGIVAVGLISVAAWLWQQRSRQLDAPPVAATVQTQQSAPPAHTVAGPPVSSVPTVARAVAAPQTVPEYDTQPAASEPIEPPNMDAAEPAERKFARGGRAEGSEQN